MRPPGVTVAPARLLPAAAVVLPIFVQGFYFVTSAAKVLGLVSSRDQKQVQKRTRDELGVLSLAAEGVCPRLPECLR